MAWTQENALVLRLDQPMDQFDGTQPCGVGQVMDLFRTLDEAGIPTDWDRVVGPVSCAHTSMGLFARIYTRAARIGRRPALPSGRFRPRARYERGKQPLA